MAKTSAKKVGVVCLKGAYHGRTMGAQFMNGPSSERNWIAYEDPNIHHINFPYPWETDNPEEFFEKEMSSFKTKGLNASENLCGFMIETYQGWGAILSKEIHSSLI